MTSGCERLNDLMHTDFYPVDYMRDTLEWVSELTCSGPDLTYGFFQVKVHSGSKHCTAIRANLCLVQ